MTQEHSITPPPGLVQQWINEEQGVFAEHIATQAARWGADQELEACIKLLADLGGDGEMIRRYRRPKPPSLKERALEALENADGADYPVVATVLTADQHALIRRALESLPD